MDWIKTRLRVWRSFARCGALLGCLLAVPVTAVAESRGTLVITRDRGGYLSERDRQIRHLQRSGQRVELRGICYSACTMYLGLPNSCVAPSAVFGFHGPSSNGTALPPREFERWSLVMASGYREPLRSWYLSTARYEILGHYQMSGAALIGMGYPQC